MTQYNLLALSPLEFEHLSRDLLQRHLDIYLESFATGRDGGIDFRASKDSSEDCVVQAKRYTDFRTLKSNLKQEAEKVKNIIPLRYILTTTVSLTPGNKDEILSLLTPYLSETSDIFGADDILNLLGQHTDILHKYYKLWLTDTAVLNRIMHSRIFNQSAFELEMIRDQVKLYVQNESFNKALHILQNHHFLIISGLPGIGKTTLARILVLYLLANDFTDFVFLNSSIDDGYEYFVEGKKQVFLFDDFLGTNFFDYRPTPKEDNRIIKFIEKISKTPDKLLILTTREYILQQAKSVFESFKLANIEAAKCILDLSTYSRINKAQILYNHLFFANIPNGHVADLLVNKQYLNLVGHKNFNPRIIETIVNQKIWERVPPNGFSKALISFFDNPESVWLYSFENALDRLSQYSLLVLLTLGTPVLIRDWETAIREFLMVNTNKLLLPFDSVGFHRTVRELENTFIQTQKDSAAGVAITYQNPSVQDFLLNYLRGKSDLIESLLASFLYAEQPFTVFCRHAAAPGAVNKIELTPGQIDIATDRIISIYSPKCARVTRARYPNSDQFFWHYDNEFYGFIEKVIRQFGPMNTSALAYGYKLIQENLYLKTDSWYERRSYINLLTDLDRSKLLIDENELLEYFIDDIDYLDDVELFMELESIFPAFYTHTIQTEAFREMLISTIKSEMKNPDDKLEDLRKQIESIASTFKLSFDQELDELETKIARSNHESDTDPEIHFADRERLISSDPPEYRQIEEIFKSLTAD